MDDALRRTEPTELRIPGKLKVKRVEIRGERVKGAVTQEPGKILNGAYAKLRTATKGKCKSMALEMDPY